MYSSLKQGVSVLEFMQILCQEEKLIKEYGSEDQRYNNSYNELTSTFCVRLYKNIMPLILEVLETMKTKVYQEKTVCLSHGTRRSCRSCRSIQIFKSSNRYVQILSCENSVVEHAESCI